MNLRSIFLFISISCSLVSFAQVKNTIGSKSKWKDYKLNDTLLVSQYRLDLNRKYWGAAVASREQYLYGKFEARIKPAKGSGMVASLFTFHDVSIPLEGNGAKAWNEIDFEFLGKSPDTVKMTTILQGPTYYSNDLRVPFDVSEDFHTYTFEWTPEYVAWFIDGVEYQRQHGDHIKKLAHPSSVHINFWAVDSTVKGWGTWSNKNLNANVIVDYFKYYEYKPRKAGKPEIWAPYFDSPAFELSWTDDFDKFNPLFWRKHLLTTWSGNLVNFIPENISYKDGYMILSITKADDPGYKGGKILDKSKPSK